MAESLVKGLVATHTHAQKDKKFDDARHCGQRELVYHFRMTGVGGAAEAMLIQEMQADITVTACKFVPGVIIGALANNPLFHIAKGDLAGGALTNITSTGMDTIPGVAARTAVPGVISTTAGVADVPKGTGLYLSVVGQGAATDLADDGEGTVIVYYVLKS